MTYRILGAIALLSGSAALAQPAPTAQPGPPPVVVAVPAPPAPQAPPVDPARFAAAQRVIDLVYPQGAIQQLWNMTPGLQAIMGMRIADFGLPFPPPPGAPADATIGQAIATHDPHFSERLRLSSEVIAEEMGRIFTMVEPDFKRLMATVYARRFSVGELDEIGRFYATPAGRRLAMEGISVFQDPEFMRGAMLMMPRVAMQMPAVAHRVMQATAHLPPPGPPAHAGPPPSNEGQRRRRPRN
ncbi:DUF2059 domain-containing protein [Allosphingosinicella sp.]|jgi:hypothetical protein|uniref:DUF2059 domain-containing protein n=1 Tax=Allosphingosinicella sp. TaxID=2823234 RepID=UPI002EFAFC70